MTPRRFDRFMIDVEIGRSLKLARLSPPERLCHIVGVLAVAAKAPVRGCLLVGEHEASAAEIALQASVPVKVARSTMSKLEDIGVLERDEELDCWRVHDWGDYNPAPKRDATNADRQRRYRERRNARRNAVTAVTGNADVTARNAGEVEGEVEAPLGPPEGDRLDNARDRLKQERLEADFGAWLADHEAVTGRTAPAVGTKARRALQASYTARRGEGYTDEQLRNATRGAHDDEYRREHNYDRAESVLRPSKVHDLAVNGEKLARGTGKPLDKFIAGFGARS